MPTPSMNTTTELETIWRDFAEPLHGFIRKRVSNEHDAEDVLQQVFVKIQTRLDSLHETEKLQGWLYRIARNAIADHYRARRPSESLPEGLADESTVTNGCAFEL